MKDLRNIQKEGNKIHCLKQPIIIVSQLCKLELGFGSIGFSALGFTSQNQGVGRVGFYWEAMVRICLQLIKIVG